MNLNWIYTAVTRIMLFWHDYVWSFLEGREFLATNWDWVLAIICLVITVRIVLFPLFVKQIKSQRAMQALQPQVKELQEKHKGDRETLQKEMMELYKREKANPLMGCLPIFLQVPVFISLFWILGRRLDPNRSIFVAEEKAKAEAGEALSPRVLDSMPADLREQAIAAQGAEVADPSLVERIQEFIVNWSHIELYGWTLEKYESAATGKLFNAPLAATMFEFGWFGERDMGALYGEMGTNQVTVSIVAAILTVIMVITTFMTTRQMILKTGWATDPTQLMMQRLMVYGIPLMLLFSGAFFPISVIIYWVVNNLFSLGQQQWVLSKYPPPKTAVPAKAGSGPGKGDGSGKGGGRAGGSRSGKDGEDEAGPAIDGKKLAPKPGAKPARPKKGAVKPRPEGGAQPSKLDAANVPPKRPQSTHIPPKRKGGSAPNARKSTDPGAPGQGANGGKGVAPSSESRRRKD